MYIIIRLSIKRPPGLKGVGKMDNIECKWDVRGSERVVRMSIPAAYIGEGETATDVARRLVGERAKVRSTLTGPTTHVVTLESLILAGGEEYPFAMFAASDIVAKSMPKTIPSCRDCGAPGPCDSRGLGYNCGCACE